MAERHPSPLFQEEGRVMMIRTEVQVEIAATRAAMVALRAAVENHRSMPQTELTPRGERLLRLDRLCTKKRAT